MCCADVVEAGAAPAASAALHGDVADVGSGGGVREEESARCWKERRTERKRRKRRRRGRWKRRKRSWISPPSPCLPLRCSPFLLCLPLSPPSSPLVRVLLLLLLLLAIPVRQEKIAAAQNLVFLISLAAAH
eukprot:3467611-Rhodomonas_salina.1